MPVADDQVAVLRAYLEGDFDTHKRLLKELDRESVNTGYRALVSATFCEAVEQRFVKPGSTADVTQFVGDVRARFLQNPDEIDPVTAERIIRAVFTDERIGDLPADVRFTTQFILLFPLVTELFPADPNHHEDNAGLNELLAAARKLADEWLG
jgi:hypothetical protein